jgi:hypothetical protein
MLIFYVYFICPTSHRSSVIKMSSLSAVTRLPLSVTSLTNCRHPGDIPQVPGGAWLHPTILVKQPFTAALRYYDHWRSAIRWHGDTGDGEVTGVVGHWISHDACRDSKWI